MKIIFFIHSLASGGAERVTATLANYWAAKGWTVIVVTVAGADRDFYALDDRIERIALNLDGDSMTTLQAVLANVRRIRSLRAVLCKKKPDIAVAMMATANVTLALAGWGLKLQTIGSERTFPPAMPLGRMWETLRQWTYPLLSGLVAQTSQSADWLKVHAAARRIAVIPNPLNYPLSVREPKIVPKDFLRQYGTSHLLLAVGRLGKEKGFDRLLQTFSYLHTLYPDWALVILGEGKQRDALQALAVSLEIEDRVIFPGAVGNVGQWFEAADAYVLTSLFEGFPNALLEALAHGVPSVAVDCETGPREILRHDVDGLLVPQDDEEALTQALMKVMGDSALRARFSERAIEVREEYAVDRVARQWEQLFSSLLAEDYQK